jgi:hypothetical protein
MARFEKSQTVTTITVVPDHSVGRVSFPSATEARVVLEFQNGNTEVIVDLTQLSAARRTALVDVLDACRRRALQTMAFTETP